MKTQHRKIPYALATLVVLAYVGYWGRGVTKALTLFFNPEEASRFIWHDSWEKTALQTAYGAGLLIIVAIGFVLYSKYTEGSLPRTLRIAGLRLSTLSDMKDAASAFVLFTLFYTFSGAIGGLINDYVVKISSGIGASRIPAEDAWPAFFSSIQAGPLEEIALVPFILMLLATVPVVCTRKVGLRAVIGIAVVARLLFHLYYGPIAFISITVWAGGIIAVWLTYRNVWGTLLAHSVSNGLITLSVGPGLHWLFDVKILVIIGCAVLSPVVLRQFFTRFSVLLKQRKELISSGRSTIFLVEEPLPDWEGFK